MLFTQNLVNTIFNPFVYLTLELYNYYIIFIFRSVLVTLSKYKQLQHTSFEVSLGEPRGVLRVSAYTLTYVLIPGLLGSVL